MLPFMLCQDIIPERRYKWHGMACHSVAWWESCSQAGICNTSRDFIVLGCVALPWSGMLQDLAMVSARGEQLGESDRDGWACQLQRSTARRPCTEYFCSQIMHVSDNAHAIVQLIILS